MEKDRSEANLIDRRFKFLLISRATRSSALIFVTLSSPLYLLLLHFDIVSIGLVYLFVSLVTVAISVMIGFLGDRIGFRKALMIGEIPALFLTLVLSLSSNHTLILVGIIVSGMTGAAGAMRGAMSPGMNAFIASNWPREHDRVFRMGSITLTASSFSIIGSLMLYSQGYLAGTYGIIGAFKVLYGISFVLILTSLISLSLLKEHKIVKKTTRIMKKASGKHTLKIIISNGINGSGIGLAIVLLPAWFELRFNLLPHQVGLIFLPSYIGTAVGSYLAIRYTTRRRKNSTLKVASVTRAIQGALMIVVAFSPFIVFAIVAYAIRASVAGFGVPNRSAVNVSGIEGGDYGTATSLQGLSGRVSQGFSGLSGYLMDIDLPFPLILGGIVQSVSGYVYYRLLRKPPE